MSDATISAAFENALKAWADAQTPAIPVAWENVEFKPPAGRYIRAWLLPNRAKSTFFDGSGRTRVGIFQVDLCMVLGTGAGSARTLADSLDAAFTVTMVQDGLRIWLTSPLSAAPGMTQQDRFVVPLTAEYKAFAS
jgi:Bacteriophage related domain of unknown function